ncbi:MAG: DegT/DnrJ/EryC1/StrS family aminotransferase [Candidatus Methylomirabilales bacterium]
MKGRPRRDEFLVFGAPAIGEAEIAEVVATLRSGWLGTGPKVERFEAEFRDYVGSRHAVALNSCTAGLHLAFVASGIRQGDEVITSPLTFSATANAIVHVGATPVFADVDPGTMNVAPDAVARALTSRTRAILPVHFAGRPCDMDPIVEIAKSHGLSIVEDAAHATEGRYRGRRVGTLGDLAAFSFYVTKNLVTGEGGMATTDNAAWAEEIRIRSLHGISWDAWRRYSADGYQPYDTLYPGYKYNMTDLQAALGIHQLARLESNLKIRERHWRSYEEAFRDHPCLATPAPPDPRDRHARHLYTIVLDTGRAKMTRRDFIAALKDENIGTGIHFTPLHLHSYYTKTFGYARGQFPTAEFIGERIVSLPLSPRLTDEDVEDVIAAVFRVLPA